MLAIHDGHGNGLVERRAEATTGHGSDLLTLVEHSMALSSRPPAFQDESSQHFGGTAPGSDGLKRLLSNEPFRRTVTFTFIEFHCKVETGCEWIDVFSNLMSVEAHSSF